MTHGGPLSANRYGERCDQYRGLIVLCRHLGDLGNIVADANGVANFTFTYDNIFSIVGANTIVGRALVLHQDMDDLGLGNTSASMMTGNSGARIGWGVIGLGANVVLPVPSVSTTATPTSGTSTSAPFTTTSAPLATGSIVQAIATLSGTTVNGTTIGGYVLFQQEACRWSWLVSF
jgi:hypothetical protein